MKKVSVILLILLLFSTIGRAANAKVVYNKSEEVSTSHNENQEVNIIHDKNLEANTKTSYHERPYTDTINAVFDRLNGKVFDKPTSSIPGGYEGPINETQTNPPVENSQGDPPQNTQGSQEGTSGVSGPAEKEYLIPGVQYDYESSILERIQRDGKASTGNVTEVVDSIGTTIHHTVSQFVIGIAPILLIIAIGLMLFSSARAVGFLLMCGVAIFVILFAPELAKVFINSISGIFY